MSFKSSDDNFKSVGTMKSSPNTLGIKTKSEDIDVKSGNASYSNTNYKSKRQICFVMFDRGKTTKEVLIETGYCSSLIAQYHQQWKKERGIKSSIKDIETKDKSKNKEHVKSCEKENKSDEFVEDSLLNEKKEEDEKPFKQKSSIDEFVDKFFSDIEPNKKSTENSSKGSTKTSIKNKSNVNDNKKEEEEVMTKEENESIKVADNVSIVKDKTKSKSKSSVEKQSEEVVKLIPTEVLATYNLNGITGVVKNNKKVAIDLGLDKYLTKEELNQLITNLKVLEKGLK